MKNTLPDNTNSFAGLFQGNRQNKQQVTWSRQAAYLVHPYRGNKNVLFQKDLEQSRDPSPQLSKSSWCPRAPTPPIFPETTTKFCVPLPIPALPLGQQPYPPLWMSLCLSWLSWLTFADKHGHDGTWQSYRWTQSRSASVGLMKGAEQYQLTLF